MFAHARCSGWQNTPASQHQRTKAGCNSHAVMNSQWSLYANSLEVSARDRYERKSEYDDGDIKLEDQYFIQDDWKNDPVSDRM